MGKLFPLDCGWRFGGDVVDHAVHSPHFVDDFVAYGTQEVVGEMAPGGGHAVCGVYGAESYHVLVGAPMTPTERMGSRMAPACHTLS